MTPRFFARALARGAVALAVMLLALPCLAQTYSYASYPFSWIDASGHKKINSVTVTPVTNPVTPSFQQLGDCATRPPIIDDTISDPIPLGFTFKFAGVNFTQARVMTNGRLQFGAPISCGAGSPLTQFPYPYANLSYSMRIYGNDLDPSLKGENASNGLYTNTPCVNRNVCYISYATIGTAPNRSFVVTWSDVPEWVSATVSPTGGYNMQLILLENGEFIYQYGTDRAGPNAAFPQVGWQGGDVSDFGTPPAGFPPNNTAIKFYIGKPVAEYRMEQPARANSIAADTSGSGYDGTMLGGVITDQAGKVCRGALIPSNTSAAVIDALDTTIPIPKIGAVGLIDFWYKSNTAWSGAGAKDEQLFDATVSANSYFFLVKRSTGTLRFVITDTTGVHQVVETAAISVAAGTWKHIAVTWNFNPNAALNNDQMIIYVDGTAVKTASFTTIGYPASQGTLYVGDNRSTNIGQNGTANSADGMIDELHVYNALGSGLIARDMTTTGCALHYAVLDAGAGKTCQPSNVTVVAHAAGPAGGPAEVNYTMPNNTTSIRLSTSTGRGDWTLVSGYGTLDNGSADDGNATYLFNGEYQATFALRHPTAATVTVHVSDGQLTDLASENQSLTIVACASGSFNACMATAPRCAPSANPPAGTPKNNSYANLPMQLANTAFALDLVKLQTDGTLDPTFNQKSVKVELLANTAVFDGAQIDATTLCPTPTPTATILLGNAVLFSNGRAPGTGIAVPANALSSAAPNYSAFRDVRVRFTCDAANCGSAITSCSTDAFSVRPTGFTVTSDMTSTPGAPVTRQAGAAFSLTVASGAPGYDGTPQIANNTTDDSASNPASVYVTQTNAIVSNPVAPVSLLTDQLSVVTNGAPGNSLPPAAIATGTSATAAPASQMRFEDAGYVGLRAGGIRDQTFTSIDQQGSDCVAGSASNTANGSGVFGCNIANQADVPVFGRFYPDHFELGYTLSNACPGFSYMDQQEVGIGMLVTAVSLNGKVLAHYAAGAVTVTGENAGSGGTTTFSPLSSRLAPALPSMAWAGGYAGRSYKTDSVTHLAGSTSIKLSGAGTIASGDLLRFAGDTTKYTVTAGTTTAATPIVITPGLAGDLAGGAVLSVLHKFTRGASPDGPYDNFALRVGVSDPDGALITVVTTGSTTGAITGANSVPIGTASDGGGVRLRYGRLRIENVYGSEKLDMPVRVTAQYYGGSSTGYVASTLDNCTPLTPATFTLSNFTPAALSGNLPPANITIVSAPPQLAAGLGYLKLLKPLSSPAITQKFSVRLNSAIPYLPGLGTETFGMFRTGPVIYMQEVH